MKISRCNYIVSLLAPFMLSTPAFAEDAQSFKSSSDTRFSVQYVETKPATKTDKVHCVSVYKVLDIYNAPEMPQQLMPGDLIEVAFPANKKRVQITPSSPLPWAEVRTDDGMVFVHIPNKYLKRRVNTKIETVWQIDNSDNRLMILKTKPVKRY